MAFHVALNINACFLNVFSVIFLDKYAFKPIATNTIKGVEKKCIIAVLELMVPVEAAVGADS